MKRIATPALCIAALACMTLGSAAATAQHDGAPAAKTEVRSVSVNEMCPIGKEAIDPNTETVMYKGQSVGFCCGGCGEKFLAWDEAKKDNFIVLAMAHEEPGNTESSKPAASTTRVGDPYMLTTCPISGGELGGMGDPIVNLYGGREVRFCCAMCVPKFEADQASYFEKIDAQIIASQMPYYPLTSCVVSDEPFESDGSGAINVVVNNRLVRTCCKSCAKDVAKNPKPFIEKLDAAVIAQQRENYPLDICIVTDEKLEEGEIVDVVYGNRLFRLCCKRCKRTLKKDPTATMVALDKAWAEQGGVQH